MTIVASRIEFIAEETNNRDKNLEEEAQQVEDPISDTII